MSDSSRRVVLLAREGAARDRLRGALNDAGAQLVLEADPTRLQPAELSAASPDVVVVALDQVTEDALDRFESVLVDPSIEVLFEEAELAAAREGWDAARWVRHLSAKLHHHNDVLPPGREPEPEQALFAPQADRPYVPPMREESYTGFDPVAVEIPSGGLSFVAPDHVAELPPELPPELPSELAPLEIEGALDEAPVEFTPFRSTFDIDADPSAPAAPEAPVELAPFESSFDFEAEPAAPAPAATAASADAPVMMYSTQFEFVSERVPPPLPPQDAAADTAPATPAPAPAPAAAPAAEKAVPVAPEWGFDDDAPALRTSAEPRARAQADGNLHRDLDAIEQRISSLELVDDRPTQAVGGAVLVLAGIGGPDAVRQLLGAMPEDFPRPLLVQQRLDGGRYDKLVAQMQRATSVLVKLAEPGSRAIAGVIYILPAGVGINVGDSGIQFNGDGGDVMVALPPADSAVLMLSGSDPALVDAAMNHASAGALVAGQSPDGCFDAAAPNALIARGGEAGQPAELAARLAARWS